MYFMALYCFFNNICDVLLTVKTNSKCFNSLHYVFYIVYDNICDVQIVKVFILLKLSFTTHRLQTNNAREISFFGRPIFLEWVINSFRLNIYAKCTYQNNF